MFQNPYLVGGFFTAGRTRRQGTVAGIAGAIGQAVGQTIGQIPYGYGWDLAPPGAGCGSGKCQCCPSCHGSPYGPYSTSTHPRIANPVFGLW